MFRFIFQNGLIMAVFCAIYLYNFEHKSCEINSIISIQNDHDNVIVECYVKDSIFIKFYKQHKQPEYNMKSVLIELVDLVDNNVISEYARFHIFGNNTNGPMYNYSDYDNRVMVNHIDHNILTMPEYNKLLCRIKFMFLVYIVFLLMFITF